MADLRPNMHSADPLITKDSCLMLAANFLLYFGFYLILPVMPFYLGEHFHTSSGQTGLILASYTVAALTVRPFSGYLLDTFSRKPLWLLSFFVFTTVFAGYLLAGALSMFIVMRVVHGIAFGAVSVSGNTMVIDIMPSSRRGEGLGYYGLAGNIAMAVGPMTGLFLYDFHSYDTVFMCAVASCAAGFMAATLVTAPVKPPVKRQPVSLDRFILVKGIPAGIALLLLSIPYGMTTTYVAAYAKEIGITAGTGIFFTLMAAGTAVSRIFSGRLVDRGQLLRIIIFGIAVVCISYFIFAGCGSLFNVSGRISAYVFFMVALLLGLGFGSMFPAFNTLFVNLGRNDQRGTATSTYLTSWDVGIGMGLTLGGLLADKCGFAGAYFFGACLAVVSLLYFIAYVGPHYRRNKVQN